MIRLVPVHRVVSALGLRMNIETLVNRSGVSHTTARRYWYGRHEDGRPVLQIHLQTLERIASAVDVDWRELLESDNDCGRNRVVITWEDVHDNAS